jgi:mono/diheme cytochrome c family protein
LANTADQSENGSLRKKILFSAIAIAAVTLTGCSSQPASKPLDQLTPSEARGYAVFQSNCAACHLTNQGPVLQGMFNKQYLPSGAPANDDRVRATILRGRGMMPAFGDTLDDQQMRDLIAYLHIL